MLKQKQFQQCHVVFRLFAVTTREKDKRTEYGQTTWKQPNNFLGSLLWKHKNLFDCWKHSTSWSEDCRRVLWCVGLHTVDVCSCVTEAVNRDTRNKQQCTPVSVVFPYRGCSKQIYTSSRRIFIYRNCKNYSAWLPFWRRSLDWVLFKHLSASTVNNGPSLVTNKTRWLGVFFRHISTRDCPAHNLE